MRHAQTKTEQIKAPKSKEKLVETEKEDRLKPGETGYCAWCRTAFVALRNYSKPQYFCQTACNYDWHNHKNMLAIALYRKHVGGALTNGMNKTLQLEAERKMHAASGLKASELVRIPTEAPIQLLTQNGKTRQRNGR